MTISLEIFLTGLMIVSTLTSVTTEGVKKMLTGCNLNGNLITGIVALVLATAVGVGYVLMTGMAFTTQTITCIVALVFMSWLCAMIGYDKVREVIKSFKGV